MIHRRDFMNRSGALAAIAASGLPLAARPEPRYRTDRLITSMAQIGFTPES